MDRSTNSKSHKNFFRPASVLFVILHRTIKKENNYGI